jgi:hypothetical protein
MRRVLVLTLLALAAGPAATASASTADNVFDPVPGNPANRLAKLPIDDYGYDAARKCIKRVPPGMKALEAWMQGHAQGVTWGIYRCEKWGKNSASLHAEGRALDWHLDVHDAADRAEAERLIDLWLAPDKNGNVHALARRMGIQELIWNCKGWFSGDGGLRPYSVCFDKKGRRKKVDDTNAHRNHIHIGLNWAGARMRTSFWQAAASRR